MYIDKFFFREIRWYCVGVMHRSVGCVWGIEAY